MPVETTKAGTTIQSGGDDSTGEPRRTVGLPRKYRLTDKGVKLARMDEETSAVIGRSTSCGDLPLQANNRSSTSERASSRSQQQQQDDNRAVSPQVLGEPQPGAYFYSGPPDDDDDAAPPTRPSVSTRSDHVAILDLDHPVVATAVHDDERDIVTAEGVKESFFQNKNRTRALVALMLLIVCGLAVGLGVSLSSRDSAEDEVAFEDIFSTASQPMDGEYDSEFGSSVSLCQDGSRIAIAGPKKGTVQVYKLNGEGGQVQLGQAIEHEIAASSSKLVRTPLVVQLSSDCNVLAVGLPYQSTGGVNNSGQVFLYEFDKVSLQWEPMGVPNSILGEAAGDFAGESISLSHDGGIVAIGSPGSGENVGHVRVFFLNTDTWQLMGDSINGTFANEAFGWSVSLTSQKDVDIIAVGSITGLGENSAIVHVYEFRSGNWKLRGSDILAGDESLVAGTEISWMVRLSFDGLRLVVSSLYVNRDDGDPTINRDNKGLLIKAFQFYNKEGWKQLGSNIHQDFPGAKSGYIISLSEDGTRMGMGDPGSELVGGLTGHAHFYELIGSQWCQFGPNIEGEAAGDMAGFAVSISGNGKRIAMGSPFSRAQGRTHGRVMVYDIDETGVTPNCDV